MVFKIKVDELAYFYILISGSSLSQITLGTANPSNIWKNGEESSP